MNYMLYEMLKNLSRARDVEDVEYEDLTEYEDYEKD